ncbi:DUF6412 domain-containing protein [Pseudonocardia sp. WMMC193]|uniref:DUF6412 domain-containing protein n=1 Tax=Pseudonocardia sp. WMMC193 TaxID=2911965 RepID=UPI001F3022A9|nr:DUF6412 domain-containing protein [Pseudonocardia sp. WMMC193]MCF7550044.1 DUF6412 domain-containing protein [Pseudonocardia sp. WMMC193]
MGWVVALLALSVAGFALTAAEPSVLVGIVGAALFALGFARVAAPSRLAGPPAVVARHRHHRDPGRRVPRLLDPDAPGRTRARAPSGPLPAV